MAKNIDYSFKRGDTQRLKKFRIVDKENNEIMLTASEQLYFTMKKSTKQSEYVLQKTIGNGIEKEEDGYYHITIETGDTNTLPYRRVFLRYRIKINQAKRFCKNYYRRYNNS